MDWKLIAIIEGVALAVVLLLVIFRKIGHPLSDAEVQQKMYQKKQKENEKKERQRLQELAWQRKLEKITTQEREIKNMRRPITFVSLSGDGFEGRTLCVQDGDGFPYTLHCDDSYLDKAPLFNGLYNASKEPHYYSKRGAVLFK